MDGAGSQEMGTVRCIAPGVIKAEVSDDSVMEVQSDPVRSSICSSRLMELCRDPADIAPSNGIENKQPNYSSGNFNTNGLDSKTNKIKQIVEDAISSESQQAVMKILDQVNELSTAEKLLLYLKLPTGRSGSVDPLRQPLNPLGSRFEIHQTITWIKTHLEEDQDVSLPKQDVYDEYIAYCNNNGMKPLSTADFGKVMKQVFPRVRPRRLGTRGNSRYCYAGMRKKMKLEAPLLPDLGEETKPNGNSCSEDEVASAASCLVREWAEKLLGVRFDTLRDLACHLVENLCVDSRSVAAFTILSSGSGNKTAASLSSAKFYPGKTVGGPPSLGAQPAPPSGAASKHRETQLQLQRKLQEREVIREQKRKLQEQAAAVNKRNHMPSTSRAKRAKLNVKETSTNLASQGEPQAICDNRAGRGRGTVTRRNVSRAPPGQKPALGAVNGTPVQENGTSCYRTAFKPSCYPVDRKPPQSLKRSHSANCAEETRTPATCFLDTASTNKPLTTFSPVQELNHNIASMTKKPSNQPPCQSPVVGTAKLENGPVNKLPIPRLSNTSDKNSNQLANVIIFPPLLQQQTQNLQPKSPKKKYKPIQPKPEDKKQEGGERDVKRTDSASAKKDAVAKTSEVSIGCLEKDALDDYLHGGNNSQEEELMKYFQQQSNSSSNEEVDSKSDKLSQLRLLLERNLKPTPPISVETPSSSLSVEDLTDNGASSGEVFLPNSSAASHTTSAGPASASLSLLSQRSQNRGVGKLPLLLPSLLSNGSGHSSLGSRRRVSFETSVVEHYQDGGHHTTSSVPPSPNTRRRIFSFMPISPGPHSPLGTQRTSSKPSSANASPFVSPRNTPVPRSRHNSGQPNHNQSGSYLATHQMLQNGGNVSSVTRAKHSSVAAKVVRSNSVNSQSSSSSQYQAPRPRAMSITNAILNRNNALSIHLDNGPGSTFVVPGSRQTMQNVPPMSPLSISAPQSPMISFQQSISSASTSDSSSLLTVPSQFAAASQSLLQEVLQSSETQTYTQEPFISTAEQPANLRVTVDPLSQEVSQFFSDDQNLTSVQQLQYRSQSVPLHRMTSALVSPLANQQQVSPLYLNQNTTAFSFSQFPPSTTSSVAPTPVPSEFMDFVPASDGNADPSADLLIGNGRDGTDAETAELNSENLNRIFNLLDDVQEDALTLNIDAAQQQNQKFLFQPSRSYPNTPLPYQSTRDPVVASFATSLPSDNNSALTSRSYPSTPLMGLHMFGGSEEDGPFHQGLGDCSNDETSSQLTLNALNVQTTAPNFTARRNINALLEQPPFPVDDELALDTLEALQECDTFTQFVQEVNNPAPDASA